MPPLIPYVLLLIFVPVTNTEGNADLKALRDKYTFQSIYLTYIPLLSLTYLLNEDGKYNNLVKDRRWTKVLPVLKKYLNDNRHAELNQAIAFLQLDLGNLQAGVKSISDRGAAITKLPWDHSTVIGVAFFSDAFLSGQTKTEELTNNIKAGKITIGKAWDEITILKDEALIPTQAISKPLQAFQMLMEANPEALKKLQKEDKPRFDRIQRFRGGLRSAVGDHELHVEEWTNISKQLKTFERRETLRDAETLELFFKAIEKPNPFVLPKDGSVPNVGALLNPPK